MTTNGLSRSVTVDIKQGVVGVDVVGAVHVKLAAGGSANMLLCLIVTKPKPSHSIDTIRSKIKLANRAMPCLLTSHFVDLTALR